MAKPSSLSRDEIRQQNLLKLLEIENGYTVTDHTGRIWGFCGADSSSMSDNRQNALDFMDDWYKTKNEEES